MPKFSILIPAYKTAFLREAIASILAQTYEDFELIISDDCSPEPVKAICDEFSFDSRIRYRRNTHNIGAERLVEHWNLLLQEATGEYVIVPGDDDVFEANYLECVIQCIEKHSHTDIIRARVKKIGAKGEALDQDPVLPKVQNQREFINDFYCKNLIPCMGEYVFRHSALLNMGGFVYFDYAWGSDDMSAFLMAGNGILHTEDICFNFRRSDCSITGCHDRNLERKKILSLLDEYNMFKSINNDKEVISAFQQRFFWYSIEYLNVYEMLRVSTTLSNINICLSWIKRRILSQRNQ